MAHAYIITEFWLPIVFKMFKKQIRRSTVKNVAVPDRDSFIENRVLSRLGLVDFVDR